MFMFLRHVHVLMPCPRSYYGALNTNSEDGIFFFFTYVAGGVLSVEILLCLICDVFLVCL